LAAALVTGIQSLGVGTSLKHLFCNNQEKWRNVVNVVVDERTQKELYERAFEYVVKTAQPWTVMTAYNQVNGDFCSEHPMVTKTLRGDWGFEGLVMTDWGATNNRVKGIRNGIDLEMPGRWEIHSNLA
jgi:beta-glucosidase